MKIQELNKMDVKELSAELLKMGIKNTKLEGAIGSVHLPSEGKFVSFEVRGDEPKAGEPDFRHIVVVTDKEDSISLSRLQLTAFGGSDEELKNNIMETGDTAKYPGTFYLKGNTTPNPQLTGNQAAALKKLIGKSFKAELVSLKRTKFIEGGISSMDEVFDYVQNVDTYKITLG